MSFQITTRIQIKATAKEVWNVFSNFNSYPEWNPFVKSLEGDVKVGNKIKVVLDGMTFKPQVISFEVNKKFEWKGKLLIKGLFDGKHIFELLENEDQTTTFIQREEFGGILIPFVKKKLNTEIKNKFENMNKKLKERVEKIM